MHSFKQWEVGIPILTNTLETNKLEQVSGVVKTAGLCLETRLARSWSQTLGSRSPPFWSWILRSRTSLDLNKCKEKCFSDLYRSLEGKS